jgi:hypothetical protein
MGGPFALQLGCLPTIIQRPLPPQSRMKELEYSPMVPLRSFDVAGRVTELQKMLDENTIAASQRTISKP